MNVASLELSKELYGLSGWHDTAYDLGYLLRKLPKLTTYGFPMSPGIVAQGDNWYAGYYPDHPKHSQNNVYDETQADTPEDAVCKLAIELWKLGILKGKS